MAPKQAEKLKVGDRVITNGKYQGTQVSGEVIERGYCAVKVKWADGELGTTHFNECDWFDKCDA